MRLAWTAPPFVLLLLATGAARADVPADVGRLILDTGRASPPPPDEDAYRVFVQGEEQMRYQAQRSFPLVATASAQDRLPGLKEQSIGQNSFGNHWLRIGPHLQIKKLVEVVLQADVLTGVFAGDLARGTSADRTPRSDLDGFSNVQLRWLYAQFNLPVGVVRLGQQPNHWGMGILANDGDHPALFGDYRYGSISERILFATKPAGKTSDFYLALAGDLVYRDTFARLTRGEQALQGVLAAFYERGPDKLGVFTTLRHQEAERTSGSAAATYTDRIDALAVDVHGKFARELAEDTFVFGEAEAAVITGSTNLVRTAQNAADGTSTKLRSYGAATVLGVVHRAFGERATPTPAGFPFGDIVAQVEVGYASGDADPYDGTQKRFTFDPNHKVGLILFDEILRWQTARAATAATDPLLTNASRPTPGVDLLPSNGGVFGAQYVNPTFIGRPREWLDLKAGMVVAQSTSEIVDAYRLATGGSFVNYRGGSPKKKDLGVEFDAGVEARLALEYGLKAQVGAQAGILFPGAALEDANGIALPPQWLAVGRLGLLF